MAEGVIFRKAKKAMRQRGKIGVGFLERLEASTADPMTDFATEPHFGSFPPVKTTPAESALVDPVVAHGCWVFDRNTMKTIEQITARALLHATFFGDAKQHPHADVENVVL